MNIYLEVLENPSHKNSLRMVGGESTPQIRLSLLQFAFK